MPRVQIPADAVGCVPGFLGKGVCKHGAFLTATNPTALILATFTDGHSGCFCAVPTTEIGVMGCPGCECPAGSSSRLQGVGSEELRKAQIPPGLHVQSTAQPCSPSFPSSLFFIAVFSVKMQLPFPGQCSLPYLSENKELLQSEHQPRP